MTTPATGAIGPAAEALLPLAKARLAAQLAADPGNPGLVWRLAEVLRQMGDLDGALAHYRRIPDADPRSRQARVLVAILSGDRPGADVEGAARPVRYVIVRDVLPPDLRRRLWRIVSEREAAFAPSGVNDDVADDVYLDRAHRHSLSLPAQAFADLRGWYGPRVHRALDEAWERLGVRAFAPTSLEYDLLSYRDGHFFNLHRDNAQERLSTRIVTAIYYFHRHPRTFQGGDVLLFDGDADDAAPADGFTRLVPDDNSLLLIPSGCFHQVTPVRGAVSLAQSRFSLVTWFHRERVGR